MDPVTFLMLATELKDLLLRETAKKQSSDGVVLAWFGTQVARGHRLPELVELYHTTMQAIALLLKQMENKNEEAPVSESH
jgi:hypothetical protein